MDGTLALDVSLATYGTAWLAGGGTGHGPTLEELSAMRYVAWARIENPRTHVGKNVSAFLGDLAISHVPRLWLVVAQSGHGVGVTDPGVGVWHAAWTRADDAWDVRYDWTPVPGLEPVRPDPKAALEALRTALSDAATFASNVGEHAWADHCWAARDGGDPPYHADIVPPDWPHRRLALTAVGAWAFGGQGSWNDIVLPSASAAEEHRRRGTALYRATLDAFLAAVNADLQ